MDSTFEMEVTAGKRFEFGKNWAAFLSVLSDERIERAEAALLDMLGGMDLRGKTFLDVGSGSGLSSLAARRLGAKVTSFDFDPSSVACTEELRARHFPGDGDWRVTSGSALDQDFLSALGTFDVVYSWGVLHHTGDMWKALDLVAHAVDDHGTLFIAIYNDQARKSAFWKRVKRTYCSSVVGKIAVCSVFLPLYVVSGLAIDMQNRRSPVTRYRNPTARGMSVYHDWFDWLGGLPFEVATIDALSEFYRSRGFTLRKLKTTSSLGNNQLVFGRG